MTDWIYQKQREAADKVRAELAKPLPEHCDDIGNCDDNGDTLFFGPWELFPAIYGSYSSEFDDMALLVLRNLHLGSTDRWGEQDWAGEGLAHQMFREMLCVADLCDYGTSPRVCFATTAFGELLPELIEKWEAYYRVHWGTE